MKRYIPYGAAALVILAGLYIGYKPEIDQFVTHPFARLTQACTTATLTHHLELGSRDEGTGGDVTKLQTYLRVWGEKYGNSAHDLPVTGYFGERTKDALASFQKLHAMPTDPESDVATTVDWENPYYGIVGPRTRALLAKSCLEGGLSSGAESNEPFVSITSPQIKTHSLSMPLTVVVEVAPVTFSGSVEIYAVPSSEVGQWQKKGRMLAQEHTLRDGFSGPLTFTITRFSGNGLPQSPESEPVVPGEYVIVAYGRDGTSNTGRVMEAMTSPITLTE